MPHRVRMDERGDGSPAFLCSHLKLLTDFAISMYNRQVAWLIYSLREGVGKERLAVMMEYRTTLYGRKEYK